MRHGNGHGKAKLELDCEQGINTVTGMCNGKRNANMRIGTGIGAENENGNEEGEPA